MELSNTEIQLDSIQDAVDDFRNGRIIIVVDDEERENEGDFICAAEKITPEIINFMSKYGRGLICSPITQERANELSLHNMVDNNTDLHGTAFTVSIDYKKEGCTTGISTHDRSKGIKALTNINTKAEDYARPGHIFPLIAKEGGVLRRTGHTEAAIDLAVLAGLYPAGVLVEILNEDGTMARLPELKVIAENFDFKLISIKDLIAYRMQKERLVEKKEEIEIETCAGTFNCTSFKETNAERSHIVISKGEWTDSEEVLCRVQSTNNQNELVKLMLTGENSDFHKTLSHIEKAGKGALILLQKENNTHLGDIFNTIKKQINNEVDDENENADKQTKHRELGIGAQIIYDMGIRKIKLLSKSSGVKRVGLIGYGLEIVDYQALD